MELSRYIHLNPVKIVKYRAASITEKGKLLRAYRWSSYPGYVQPQKRDKNISYKMVLTVIGGKDSQKSRQEYKAFMIEGLVRDSSKELWEDVRGQAILGSDTFVDRVYDTYLKKRCKDTREQGGVEEIGSLEVTVDQIAQKVAAKYKVAPAELYLKRSSHSEARSVLIELCRVYMSKKMRVSSIGRALGGIRISAVSKNTKRLRVKMSADSVLKKRYELIEQALQR